MHPEIRKWDIYDGTGRAPSRDMETNIKIYTESFRQVPTDENRFTLLAKLNGMVVGWVAVHCLDVPRKHVGDIGISVHPDNHGKGIGTELLKACVRRAKEKGFKRLEISTTTTNKVMCRAAEKAGFHLEGTRKGAIEMRRQLVDEALYASLLNI